METNKRQQLDRLLQVLSSQGVTAARIAREVYEVHPATFSRRKQHEGRINQIIRELEAFYKSHLETVPPPKYYQPIKKKQEKVKVPIIEVKGQMPSLEELTKEIKAKKPEEVWLIDTWMPYLIDDRADRFFEWPRYIKKIKILILKPDAETVKVRARALDMTPESAQEIILSNLKKLLTKADESGYIGDLEVRIYEELPAIHAFFIAGHKIHFGTYLSTAYSQNTFFFAIQDDNNHVAIDLKKHFEEIWEHRSESISFEELVEIRQRIHEQEKESELYLAELLGRLREQYVIFNLDEDESMIRPFQISRLELNKAQRKVKLIYQNRREPNDEITSWGTIEVHGTSSLLFRFKSKNFFLEILAHILPEKHPEVIQSIYLHANRQGDPRSSIGLLVDPEENIETRGPSRDDKDVHGLIAEYLTYDKTNVLQFKKRISKFNELKIDRGESYESLSEYEGNWYIYYHERYTSYEVLKGNQYISSIGRGTFTIRKDTTTGEYYCKLTTPDSYEFEGKVKYKKLKSSPYLIFTLYEKEEESKYLSFLFYKGNSPAVRRRLYGVYNITYFNEPSLGCGVAIMEQSNTSDDFCPQSINLLDSPATADKLKILKYLSFRQGANIEISRRSRQKVDDQPFRFHGIYKVYSYGRRRTEKKKSILLGALEIHPSGYVEYKGHHQESEACGIAFRSVSSNLYIELRNKINKRLGYYLLYTTELRPEKDRIYCGILLGLGVTTKMPLGKRVIFEFLPNAKSIDEVSCKKIDLHDEEINNIPPLIRKTLSGRLENFISFARSNAGIVEINDLEKELTKRSINLMEVFVESSLYKILNAQHKKDIDEAIVRLRKAVEHGYTDIPAYLKKVENNNPEYLEDLQNHEEFRNLCNWLKL